MSEFNDTPSFNLGVVIQETGINADTLRAWERRYGLPQPARTEGRHRLYSQRDIDTIKWLSTRQAEGMSISKAVNLWRTLESEGNDPLLEMPSPLSVPSTPPPAEVSLGAKIEELREDWIQACLDFNETTAEYIASHAFALFPAETVLFEILFAGLATVGEAWYQRRATVQQEHFAAALVTRRLNALIATAPPPIHRQSIIVGCPPKEDHTLSALLITYLLRSRGWHVVYLGANVPLQNFQETVDKVKPALVVLVAQMLPAASNLKDVATELAEAGIPIAFGGMIFSQSEKLAKQIPGFYLGNDLHNVLPVLEHLLTTAPSLTTAGIDDSQSDSLQHYVEMRAVIEERLVARLGAHMPYEYLQIANQHVAQDIMAALNFGDMGYLGSELNWISGLLENAQVSDEMLRNYLGAYYQAADELLNERGAQVVDWLARVS
ncbi:MAG: MerR family transcriptional regulator [Anaerolineales bacterium]|nr:MerR family transcriptional regulator [Anaerolineales bacterium]